MAASKLQAFWNHPAGPKTTVTFTGLIWSRYSLVITPLWLLSSFEDIRLKHGLKKNWNLFSVNVTMVGTGLYQMARKLKHDYFSETEGAGAKE